MLFSHSATLATRAHAARRRMPIGRLLKGILALLRLVLVMTLMLIALTVLNLAGRVGVWHRQRDAPTR
jgi:hypothetical protein